MAAAAAVLLPFAASAARPDERPAPRPDREERLETLRSRALVERDAVRAWARQRGVSVRSGDGNRVVEIKAIRGGRPVYYITLNDNAAISTAADAVRNTAPYGVDGSGVIVGVWDGGGVRTTHQEFGSRVTAVDAVPFNFHSTHVAGTIGASGVVARAQGMAPAVLIDSYDWTLDDYEMSLAAADAPGQAGRIPISNHSYGIIAGWYYASWLNPWTGESGWHWWGNINTGAPDAFFGQYGDEARAWDEVVYTSPYYLPFKAAGNERDDNPQNGDPVYYTVDGGDNWISTTYDSSVHPGGDGTYKSGYDSIPYIGNAKNIMTVGAVNDAVLNGDRSLAPATMLGFSSWGPADDGRIKPDIVANGYNVYSASSSTDASYQTLSGTSMSTPNASGSAALLVDYYDDLFPGQAMRASTLKGLIIHTADDLGRPGPDYQYGWGLMNTLEAARLLRNYAAGGINRLAEAVVSYAVPVATYDGFPDSSGSIRVTLCWTDPPGTATGANDSRTPVLVNDLDLKVTGPDGQVYYPYRLSYSDPTANALADAKNSVDNVEQIDIPAPVFGVYTITVEFDGELYDGEQTFSLLVTGLTGDYDGDGMPDNWEIGYFDNSTGATAYADSDGDGMDNLSEYIAGTDPTNPGSYLGIDSFSVLPPPDEDSVVVGWDGVPGRVYNLYRTESLLFPFQPVATDVLWDGTVFTDSVPHAFYKIDVRLEE